MLPAIYYAYWQYDQHRTELCVQQHHWQHDIIAAQTAHIQDEPARHASVAHCIFHWSARHAPLAFRLPGANRTLLYLVASIVSWRSLRLTAAGSRSHGLRSRCFLLGLYYTRHRSPNKPILGVLSKAVSRYKAVKIVWRDWGIPLIPAINEVASPN